MNKTSSPRRIPSYRLHKSSGQALVEVNGRRVYLGVHNTPESLARYAQLIAEWQANGGRLPVPTGHCTVADLSLAYWKYAKGYYVRPDGTPTNSQSTVKSAIRSLRKLYGHTRVTDFGPNSLRAVRQSWVDGTWGNGKPYSRGVVNKYTAQVVRIFKWGCSVEMVPVEVYQALATVPGLRAGRSEAYERDPVLPVPEGHIDALKPFVSRPVWALIQLQRYTGARPGELLKLRVCDIEVTDGLWRAKIVDHKMQYRGKARTLFFGPRAQEVMKPFMQDRPLNGCLFDPRDAIQDKAARAKSHRRPGQSPTPRKSDRKVNAHYTKDSYRRAIQTACDKAGVQRWTPHQLRHTAATTIREKYGLEAAQVVLGHTRADVTQIYALANEEKAAEAMRRMG